MYVSKIRMQNFRCYTDFTMQFSPKVTVIVAENGRGKPFPVLRHVTSNRMMSGW